MEIVWEVAAVRYERINTILSLKLTEQKKKKYKIGGRKTYYRALDAGLIRFSWWFFFLRWCCCCYCAIDLQWNKRKKRRKLKFPVCYFFHFCFSLNFLFFSIVFNRYPLRNCWCAVVVVVVILMRYCHCHHCYYYYTFFSSAFFFFSKYFLLSIHSGNNCGGWTITAMMLVMITMMTMITN